MGQKVDMHALTVIDGWNHEARPDPTTIRSEPTGEPASLLSAPGGSYPLAAECARCGRPIRLGSRSLLADWEHAEPGPPSPRRPT
jgi:hypothetical protein